MGKIIAPNKVNDQRNFSLPTRQVQGRWLRLLLLASVLACFDFPCWGQAASGDLEARVKAAYIYNFTKFIYWDRGSGDIPTRPITIFVLGTDPIGDLLEDFSKKQTSDHPLVVKKIAAETNDLSSCHLFFIAQSAKQQLPSLFRRLLGTNILTVSDIPGFAQQGGMIGFIIKDGRVKIEINLQSVTNAGLKISAKLLEIAKIVPGED